MRNYSFQLFSKREKAQSKTTTSQLVELCKHNNKMNAFLGEKSPKILSNKNVVFESIPLSTEYSINLSLGLPI